MADDSAHDTDVRGRLGAWVLPDSGPVVARTFHAALGLVFVVAFASLAAQTGPLFAAGGLAPVADALAQARAAGAGFFAAPTLFWAWSDDAALWLAAGLGGLAGALALAGVRARACLGAATLLYLSFVGVGAPFLGFQWDSLLIECGALALLLPRDRAAPAVHVLLVFLWFKVYFESGLAKWGSPIGDWADGSAMSYYYETAPIPTRLAWYAHHLPAWWHALESRATLALELVAPPLAFCGRRGRLVALAGLTGLQALNLATANYGYFVYLTLALHLFLLRDADLLRLRARLPWARARGEARGEAGPPGGAVRAARAGVAALYLGLSVADARVRLGGAREGLAAALQPYYAQFRVVNSYHLFAQITRERVEPEFAGFDGAAWRSYDMAYKPGPLDRPPPLVAPHQPRLDFQLWFYGLRARQPPPAYVRRLLERLCAAPGRVQGLFAGPLLPGPERVRVRFWRYRFTAPGEPGWWRREPAAPERVMACGR